MDEIDKSFREERAGFEHAKPTRPRDWVDDLIEMTRPGIDMELPERAFLSRVPAFVYDDFD